MDGLSGGGVDDVDPPSVRPGEDVFAGTREDGDARGLFGVLGGLFFGYTPTAVIVILGDLSTRSRGEDVFDWDGRAHVDESGLVFEEGCHEEETGVLHIVSLGLEVGNVGREYRYTTD